MSTSVFVGHAKPPANTVSGQMYTILSVVCEVDMETGVIIAAEFTVATDLAKDYLNRLLSGRSLATEEDAIVAELEECYFPGTQKALIQSFRDMAKRYRAQVAAAAGLAGRLTRLVAPALRAPPDGRLDRPARPGRPIRPSRYIVGPAGGC